MAGVWDHAIKSIPAFCPSDLQHGQIGGCKPFLFCSHLKNVGLVIQSWPAEFSITGLLFLIVFRYLRRSWEITRDLYRTSCLSTGVPFLGIWLLVKWSLNVGLYFSFCFPSRCWRKAVSSSCVLSCLFRAVFLEWPGHGAHQAVQTPVYYWFFSVDQEGEQAGALVQKPVGLNRFLLRTQQRLLVPVEGP